MEAEPDYPYTATDGTCHADKSGEVKMIGWSDITAESASALTASVTKGPTSISVAAGNTYFQLY